MPWGHLLYCISIPTPCLFSILFLFLDLDLLFMFLVKLINEELLSFLYLMYVMILEWTLLIFVRVLYGCRFWILTFLPVQQRVPK